MSESEFMLDYEWPMLGRYCIHHGTHIEVGSEEQYFIRDFRWAPKSPQIAAKKPLSQAIITILAFQLSSPLDTIRGAG